VCLEETSRATEARTLPQPTERTTKMIAMHRMMDHMLAPSLLDDVFRPEFIAPALSRNSAPPRLDESEDAYRVSILAPGVKSEDLKVSIDGERLKCVGHTKAHDRAHAHVVNWTINLPRDADVDQATAGHVDGIVLVKIPKKASKARFQLEVRTVELDESSDDSYHLSVSAPGLAAADLSITFDAYDNAMQISGQTKRTGARIDRRFQLPRDASAMDAEASHIDGILTIRLPKQPSAAERVIELNDQMDDDEMDDNEMDKEVLVPSTSASNAEAEGGTEEKVMI